MKPSSAYAIFCVLFILSGIAGSVAVDRNYDKSVSISMHIDNGKIATKSVEIYYGSAPNIFPMQEGFRAELVAADGTSVKNFMVWDPRIQFGDGTSIDMRGPRIRGVVDQQRAADFVVIFPFNRNVTEFRLYDSADGTLLSSVNVKPSMDAFFASYPLDPDNPALPVLPGSRRGSAPVPGTGATGQLLGVLSIGAGALLILGAAFAYFRFLKKQPTRVLVVDDDSGIIEVIERMLASGGYSTRSATSGEECLRELESAIPDIILLDIGMKPMDGWETLQRIKKDPGTRRIPVIMLTGHELTPRDVENYGICIEDFLRKPVTMEELYEAIAHVFARQERIKEEIAAVKDAGIDPNELCECARLARAVDVNKRLWNILVSTYDREAVLHGPESDIPVAIKNTKRKIQDQEYRLRQIRRKLGSGAKG